MVFLFHFQIVHCDLAARNILIAEGFVLKIADFGFARGIHETEHYQKLTTVSGKIYKAARSLNYIVLMELFFSNSRDLNFHGL